MNRSCSAVASERSRVMGCKAHFTRERARHRLVRAALCYGRVWFPRWRRALSNRHHRSACEGGVALVPRFPPHYKVAPRPSRGFKAAIGTPDSRYRVLRRQGWATLPPLSGRPIAAMPPPDSRHRSAPRSPSRSPIAGVAPATPAIGATDSRHKATAPRPFHHR